MRSTTVVLAFALATGCGGRIAEEVIAEEAARLVWPTPDGWTEEHKTFPLSFAPTLPYRGVEELRFAPAFYDPAAETYFTYAIAFVLEPQDGEVVPFAPDRLAADLGVYFTSLGQAMSKLPIDPTAPDTSVSISALDERHHVGEIATVDGFHGRRPLHLHFEAEGAVCGARRVIVLGLSPQPRGSRVWALLREARAAFACQSP